MRIEAGDLVCVDADGLVVVPTADVEVVLAAAVELESRERDILAAIARGGSTVEIYRLKELT